MTLKRVSTSRGVRYIEVPEEDTPLQVKAEVGGDVPKDKGKKKGKKTPKVSEGYPEDGQPEG
jgi:hypothetical protein